MTTVIEMNLRKLMFNMYLYSCRPLFRGSSDVDQLGKILE